MKIVYRIAILLSLMAGQFVLAQDLHTFILEPGPQDENRMRDVTLRLDDDLKTGGVTLSSSFVLKARVGDQIRWVVRPSADEGETIRLTRIQYIRGPRIFSKDTIAGEGVIQATIIRGGNTPYVYEIHFFLNNKTKEEVITSRIQIEL